MGLSIPSSVNLSSLHLSKTVVPAVLVGGAAAYLVGKHAYENTEDAVIESLNGKQYEVIWAEDGREIRKYRPKADLLATLKSSIAGVALAGAAGLAFERAKSLKAVGLSQGSGAIAAAFIGAGIGIAAGTVTASMMYAGAELHRGT